jgi:uncharacterized protein
VDRLFLDANVLFSAAYREDAGVTRLWKVRGATLVTSEYAIEEARRNLSEPEQIERLDNLLADVERVASLGLAEHQRQGIRLPAKDWPILGGAVGTNATHLITGDVKDFGPYFGKKTLGVLVLSPAQYLKARS